MQSIILVAATLASLFGISAAHPAGSLAVARIVEQAKPYNAVQSKSTAISVARLSPDELLWCHGAGLPADMTSLMEMTSILKGTDDYYNWLLCYYSVKIDDLQHSIITPAASVQPGFITPKLERYTPDKRIFARNADTESTVTVTVTTIPEYCTSSSLATVVGVSTGSAVTPASITASASAPAAPASGTTSSPATAVVPVPNPANATGAASTPATPAVATSTAGSAPSNSTAATASNNSTSTVPVSSSSSNIISTTTTPSTSISAAATSSTEAPTSDTNCKTPLPILVTAFVALVCGMLFMT